MKDKTPEEAKEDLLDFHMKALTECISEAFKAVALPTDAFEAKVGFFNAGWAYHLKARELVLSEAIRIVRRTAYGMIDEGSNIDNETIETLASAFIANIQKAKVIK